MRKQIKYFGIGFILILFSSPLGHLSVKLYGAKVGNLTGEYIPLLVGFISAYSLIGLLLSGIGIIRILNEK